MIGDVRVGHLFFGLDQHARGVDRYIAVADDHHRIRVQIGLEVGEVGMAVIPTDKISRSKDADLVLTGNAELAVAWCADGQNDGVVHLLEFLERDIPTDFDIAVIGDAIGQGGLLVDARDFLGGLMIGGNAAANKTERRGQAFDNIDAYILVALAKSIDRVEPAWSRADYGNVYWHKFPPETHGL